MQYKKQKSNGILKMFSDRPADRQTGRPADRQTGRPADRPACSGSYRRQTARRISTADRPACSGSYRRQTARLAPASQSTADRPAHIDGRPPPVTIRATGLLDSTGQSAQPSQAIRPAKSAYPRHTAYPLQTRALCARSISDTIGTTGYSSDYANPNYT